MVVKCNLSYFFGDKMNIESTGLDYPKYVPNVKKFPGEYYNSFAELKAARPDLFEGEESAYHVVKI